MHASAAAKIPPRELPAHAKVLNTCPPSQRPAVSVNALSDRAPVPIPAPSTLLQPAPASFDYAALGADLADELRAVAVRIKQRLKDSVLQTGRDLAEIKAKLPHGDFLPWVEAEFGMKERTAQNYMSAAAFVEGKSEKISLLPATALFFLAAPSAPQKVVTEIIGEIDAGTQMRVADIRERLTEGAALEKKASSKTLQQLADERAKEQAARERERKRKDKLIQQEAEEKNRKGERARAVVEMLVEKFGADGVTGLFTAMRGLDWFYVERAGRERKLINSFN